MLIERFVDRSLTLKTRNRLPHLVHEEFHPGTVLNVSEFRDCQRRVLDRMKVSEGISKRTPSLKESVTRTNHRLSTDDEVQHSLVSSRKVDNLASSRNKTECKLTFLKIVYFHFIEKCIVKS